MLNGNGLDIDLVEDCETLKVGAQKNFFFRIDSHFPKTHAH